MSMTGRDRRAIRESIPRLVGVLGLDWTGLGGWIECTRTQTQRRKKGGDGGIEGGTRALGSGTWTHLDRFRNEHGQAGVSDLDLGGWTAAVIGGLGFGAVVRAWALLCLLLVQFLPGAVPPWCSLPTRWLFLEILLYYQVLPYSPSSSPSCTCPPCPPAIWVMHLPLQPEPALAPFTPLLRRSGTGWSNMARSPLPRLVTLWALSSLG